MAAIVADIRSRLGGPDRVEFAKHHRAPVRIYEPVRAHVCAGAEDSRPDTKSLRA